MAYEHAASAVESDRSCDDRSLVRKVRAGTSVTREEWLRLFRMVHGPRYETHRRRRVERAESNRRVRRLAITTLATLGTGPAISLGVPGGVDLPVVGRLVPPPFLVEMSDLLGFAAPFGLLAATVGDLLKRSTREATTAPDGLPAAPFGLRATAARLTFGAASAVILLVVLYSGVVPAMVIDATQLTAAFALGVSLAAGFSERLLLRAMEQMSVPAVRRGRVTRGATRRAGRSPPATRGRARRPRWRRCRTRTRRRGSGGSRAGTRSGSRGAPR